MTARIFNLNDDERFVRAPFEEAESDPFEILPGGSNPDKEGFSGAISLPLLPDLIQIYTTSMASGALTIRRAREFGTIWFDRGAMVHAACGKEVGVDAVYRLLQWHDGQFSLDTAATAPVRSIAASWQEVLMEGCRRLDEQASGRTKPAPSEEGTAEVEVVLGEIEQSVDGLLVAGVFESSAGTLIAQRTPGTDLTVAGPVIAEMVRLESSVMDALGRPMTLQECFSIFGDQVHILVPLQGSRVLYLAVRRDDANLALLRRVVERVCKRFS